VLSSAPTGAPEPHLRNHTFVPPAPAPFFLGAGAFMAILLVSAAGLIICILILAIVAFLLLLDDSSKDEQTKHRPIHQ